MKSYAVLTVSLATLQGLVGCSMESGASTAPRDEPTVRGVELALAGEHLTGIGDAEFNAAEAAFATSEDADDGLGPIFNDRACSNCHNLGAIGGAGTSVERRFGRFEHGAFDAFADQGGTLRQLFSLGEFTNARGESCYVALEQEPERATVTNVGRLTTPLFGLGLVEAMPDEFFVELAASEPEEIRGAVNFVQVLLPNPSDVTQQLGSMRVGRFGWKAGVSTLVQFAADAYVNEMGITTQHCIDGVSIETFAVESAPNGVPVDPACEDNKPGVDDAVGEGCAPGQTEIQEDVAEFTRFMTFLAPPGRDRGRFDPDAADGRAADGGLLFDSVGCSGCHTSHAFVTPDLPSNGVPGGRAFHPFSDFLLHDMGSLGDGIGAAGDSEVYTRRMRTAPLWGIRFRMGALLHDGRAADIASAIAAHDGQGAAAADAFDCLSAADRSELLEFVSSL